MQALTTEHCGSVHYITIGDSRLLTAAGLTRSPLYLIGDAASRCGLSRVGYFIPLNGRRPLNGHPPSIKLEKEQKNSSYTLCCILSPMIHGAMPLATVSSQCLAPTTIIPCTGMSQSWTQAHNTSPQVFPSSTHVFPSSTHVFKGVSL